MTARHEQAVSIFNKHAKAYEEKFMDFPLYKATYEKFCDLIALSRPAVLDIACGPGNFSRFVLDRFSGATLLGTDLSTEMLELARKNNPEAEFRLLDSRRIDTIDEEFQVILCAFAIPYLSPDEVENLIETMAALLSEDGLLYLSAMEGTPEDLDYSGAEGDSLFVNYHQEVILKRHLQANAFEVIESFTQAYEKEDGNIDTDRFIFARKRARG